MKFLRVVSSKKKSRKKVGMTDTSGTVPPSGEGVASSDEWPKELEEGNEGEIKCAARKCERIMEAMEAVQNKQMKTSLEERLAKAQSELDRLIESGSSSVSPTKRLLVLKSKMPKPRTTESVKSRFKGVYGVRSLKKGSVRWTAKLLKDNTWYRDGSYTDEAEAARAVDARLRAWGRDDECNFDEKGFERPARLRKHGSSKRRPPSTEGTEPEFKRLAQQQTPADDQAGAAGDEDDDEDQPEASTANDDDAPPPPQAAVTI